MSTRKAVIMARGLGTRMRADDGTMSTLTPDEHSAEGRRARFDREHPIIGRWIGFLSLLILLAAFAVIILQIIEGISGIPPLAERFGTFSSPVDLPLWGNIAVALVAAVASTERATRLRYNSLLDGAS